MLRCDKQLSESNCLHLADLIGLVVEWRVPVLSQHNDLELSIHLNISDEYADSLARPKQLVADDASELCDVLDILGIGFLNADASGPSLGFAYPNEVL